MKSKLLLFLLINCSIQFSFSQTYDSTFTIKEVCVNFNKTQYLTGNKIYTLDSLALKNHQTSNLNDILQQISALNIKTYGSSGISNCAARGKNSNHTKVVWNGLDINSQTLGQSDLSLLPITGFTDLKIHMGGSALKYGSGALGALIEINSNSKFEHDKSIEILSEIGSFHNNYNSIKGGYSNKKLYFNSLILNKLSKNDFVVTSYENRLYKQQYSESKSIGIIQNFAWKVNDKNIIDIHIWKNSKSRFIPPLTTDYPLYNFQKQLFSDNDLKLSAKWKYLKNNFVHHFLIGFVQNEQTFDKNTTEIRNYTVKSTTEYDLTTQTHIEYSVSYEQAKAYSLQLNSNPERKKISTFCSMNHRLSNSSVFLIFREEYTDMGFSPILPSLGYNYYWKNKSSHIISVNLSRNYNLPSLNDLYWYPGGNPNLLPEVSKQFEINYDLEKSISPKITLKNSTGIFASITNNWIQWSPSLENPSLWFAKNYKQVYSRGIEHNISLRKNGNIIYNFELQNSFILSTNKNTFTSEIDIKNKQLIYTPKHKTAFVFTTIFKNLSVMVQYNNLGKRYLTSNNEDLPGLTLPAIYLFDVGMSYGLKIFKRNLNIHFKIKNLTNLNYVLVQNLPQEGRSFWLTIQLSIM